MGDKQKQCFQLSFNNSLKIDFQRSRVTSDGGLILVRELVAELCPRVGFIVTNPETYSLPSSTNLAKAMHYDSGTT
jgi:hypothetical protein